MDSKLIETWKDKGLITEDQAVLMIEDLRNYRKEQGSQRLIVGLSTLGAIVLGLGVILFVASNWQYFGAEAKVLMLSTFAFVSLLVGYYLQFGSKSFPKVGSAIILLASFIYCATIFLVAQIYHVNAYNHQLILLCLMGILPLAYILKSKVFGLFLMIGFYIWLGFFAFRSLNIDRHGDAFVGLPVLFVVSSVLLYYVGGFHFVRKSLAKLGMVYRYVAINVGMLFLLVLTFGEISGKIDRLGLELISNSIKLAYSQLSLTVIIVAVVSVLIGIVYAVLNPLRSRELMIEMLVTMGLLMVCVVFLILPRESDLFTYIFNLLMILIMLGFFVLGYIKHDMALVNSSILYISIYLMVRYVDFFWQALDKSLFFIIGGAILVGGGMFLERQRRFIKLQFNYKNE